MAVVASDVGDDIELDDDSQGQQMEQSEQGDACGVDMWQFGARDELGCLSSGSDSDDEVYLPYTVDSSEPDADTEAADESDRHWFCCCPLAPLEHQTQLICEQLRARGWYPHPSEVVPKERCPAVMPDGRGRPQAGRRVDFSNSAFHSTGWLFSDDPCEALYDRLQLANLVRPQGLSVSQGTRLASGLLAPPTACLRACRAIGPEEQQQLAAVKSVGGGCVFLKANYEHFGTGTRVFSGVDDALAAVASAKAGQEFVLQPHVPRPMLWHRRKFHVRVWALFVARPPTDNAGSGRAEVRGWLHDGGTVAVASEPWQPESTDPAAQITSSRSPRFVYDQWEHYPQAHAAITANATELSGLLAASWRGRAVRRAHFSLAGLDYILDENCQQAHLLEANYGSRLIDQVMVAGVVGLVFCGEDGAAQCWRELGS